MQKIRRFKIISLTNVVTGNTICPSSGSDLKQNLGLEKGPFHRVVGQPQIFGSAPDFLLLHQQQQKGQSAVVQIAQMKGF